MVPLEAKLSLENDDTVSNRVLEERNSEYHVPITAIVEELSINSTEEPGSSNEKSHDDEIQPEVVQQVDSCQKSVDNEVYK